MNKTDDENAEKLGLFQSALDSPKTNQQTIPTQSISFLKVQKKQTNKECVANHAKKTTNITDLKNFIGSSQTKNDSSIEQNQVLFHETDVSKNPNTNEMVNFQNPKVRILECKENRRFTFKSMQKVEFKKKCDRKYANKFENNHFFSFGRSSEKFIDSIFRENLGVGFSVLNFAYKRSKSLTIYDRKTVKRGSIETKTVGSGTVCAFQCYSRSTDNDKFEGEHIQNALKKDFSEELNSCNSDDSRTIKIDDQNFFIELNQPDSWLKEDESQVKTIVFNRKSEEDVPDTNENIPGPMKVIASGFTALAVTGFVVMKGLRSVFWN